ncbi:hypothetical protein ACED61_17605 [Vibrio sp. 1F148]|uniref:hypothetical protein n=1 Tax=Vibrio sp. 1F148 TaxID=3230003 RepID=UPI00352E0B09
MKIKTTNLRKLRYYEKKFSFFVSGESRTYDNSDIDFRLDNINNLLNEIMEKDKKYIKQGLLSLRRDAEINLIPDSKLSWIDKENKRLCYFIWSFIRLANEDKIEQTIEYNQSIFKDKNSNYLINSSMLFGLPLSNKEFIYLNLNLHNKPCNINEIHTLIINYIDDVDLSIDKKEKLISNIYLIWSDIEKKEKYSWINKENLEQLQWIIDYLYKSNISIEFIPVHTNKCQIYHVIISALDLWNENDNYLFFNIDKKTLISKMKKSWKQKQYRDKLNSEQLTLNSANLKKLEVISNHISKSNIKSLEYIIDEKYKEIVSR